LRTFNAWLVCAFILTLTATAALAAEHPANGQITRDVPISYGTADYGYPDTWSRADMTFGTDYPAPAELIPPERYMLAGTMLPKDPENGLPAWIESAANFCLDYHSQYGVVPGNLTPDAVSLLYGQDFSRLSKVQQALPYNPLTGATPRLNAQQFAPGDLYVRVLTEDEKYFFAERRTALYDAWFTGNYRDPATGLRGKVSLESAVLYIRAYGASGVIYEDLVYRLSEPDFTKGSIPTLQAKRIIQNDDWDNEDNCIRGS